MNKSIASTQGQKNKRYSVKKPSIAHFFVSQSRLTDAVSVIFGELLSYEHPPKQLCIVSAAFVQNVRILIRYHCRLRMTGIPLHRLNIAAIQLEFAVLLCGQKLLAPCVANMILYGIYVQMQKKNIRYF